MLYMLRFTQEILLALRAISNEEEAHEAAEEASNIFIGHGVSSINGIFKDKEMLTFKITAATEFGDICINVGFSEGD